MNRGVLSASFAFVFTMVILSFFVMRLRKIKVRRCWAGLLVICHMTDLRIPRLWLPGSSGRICTWCAGEPVNKPIHHACRSQLQSWGCQMGGGTQRGCVSRCCCVASLLCLFSLLQVSLCSGILLHYSLHERFLLCFRSVFVRGRGRINVCLWGLPLIILQLSFWYSCLLSSWKCTVWKHQAEFCWLQVSALTHVLSTPRWWILLTFTENLKLFWQRKDCGLTVPHCHTVMPT